MCRAYLRKEVAVEIKLARYGPSFATRERARSMIKELAPIRGDVALHIEGAMVSPSFLAEILTLLVRQADSVLIAGDPLQTGMAERVIRQLSLAPKVRVVALAG